MSNYIPGIGAGAAAGTAIAPGVGTVIGAGIGAASGIIDNIFNSKIDKNNREYSERMTREQWAREDQIRAEAYARDDSAVQRRVADLKASGINPMLATGSPAAGNTTTAASAPVTSFASRRSNIGTSAMQGMANGMQLSRMGMENNLMAAQSRKLITDSIIAERASNREADLYARQKAAGIIPGQNFFTGLADQLAAILGVKASDVKSPSAEAIDSFLAWLKRSFPVDSGGSPIPIKDLSPEDASKVLESIANDSVPTFNRPNTSAASGKYFNFKNDLLENIINWVKTKVSGDSK